MGETEAEVVRASPALRVLVVALSAATIAVCWPLWPALLLAAWTAGLARPLLARLERALAGRRRAATALSLLLFLAVSLPLGLVVAGAVSGARELAAQVAAAPTLHGAIEAITGGPAHAPALPRSLPALLELIERYGPPGMSVLGTVADWAAAGLVALLIYFGGAFVLLLEGPRVWAWARLHAPLSGRELERLGAAFHETGRGLIVGVGLTSATQGLVATLVYLAMGVPRWWVLGPLTGLASMIPLVGSALVWGPIALGLWLRDQAMSAAILAGLGVGVIGVVDNVLRPFYAHVGALRMPTFLLFVSIFGGLAVLGPEGALLGPLVVRLWLEALELRREAR